MGLVASLLSVVALAAPQPAAASDNSSPVYVSGSNGWLAASIGASQERDNGYMHTCTVTTTGTVKCSGHLQYGEGGNNIVDDVVPYPTNVKLTGTSPVAKTDTTAGPTIASTNRNSCVIYNATGVTGGVQCWGRNDRGQMADGTTTQRNLPVVATMTGGSALTGVTAISGNGEDDGTGTFCAVKNGGVYCWGYGGNGRLGNGGTSDQTRAVVAIAEGSGVTGVATGSASSCAVINGGASGTVKCWGWNGYGQLGDSTTTERTTPVTVLPITGSGALTGAVQLGGGGWTFSARMNDGTVVSWGHNGQGQIGDNTTSDRSRPVQVKDVGGSGTLSGVTNITSGARHSCVVVGGGEMRCWGRGASGELGDGASTQRNAPVKVINVGQSSGSTNYLTNVSSAPGAVSGGTFYTCMRKIDGTMLCMGYNPQGNNGNGTTDQTAAPTYVNGASPGLWSAAAVAVSRIHDSTGSHSCAVTTAKQVKCWGWGGQGQMGNNTTTGVNRSPSIVTLSTAQGSSPVASTSVSGGNPISAGSGSSCVIVNTASITGGLQCWGYNGNGQLGDGTTTQRNTPTPVKAGAGPSTSVGGTAYLSGVTAVASSAWGSPTDVQHTCALANGGVFCWGWGYNGQLGNNTSGSGAQSTLPVQAIATGSNVTDIATGDETSCALFSNGTGKCWGWNQYGQLADGTTTSRSVPTSTLGSSMTSISLGAYSQCVINTSQNVYCGGYNGNGEVGDNTTTQRNGYALVVGTSGTGSLNGATSVSAGMRYACAVAGGQPYCWGRDDLGVLGKGTSGVQSNFPKAVIGLNEVNNSSPAAPGLTGASTDENGVIGAGSYNTCVRMASGAVTCWGRDNDGELGSGQLVSNNTTITGAASPAANVNGWNNSNITVTFTCSSSVTVSCPAPVVLSTEGTGLSASGTAVDASGFDASATVSGLKLDKTNPTGSGTATTSANGAGWYKADVAIAWSCSDALSGIGTCPANSTITGEGASLSTTATAVDNASNNGTLTSPTVKIDRTKPSTSVSAIPTWSTSNVTVTLTPSDNLSGVSATNWTLDGGGTQSGTSIPVTTDGVHTLTYWSTDAAGNIENTNTATVRVDKTAPTISAGKSPVPNAGGWNNSNVTVTFTCSDGTSGVASCTPPVTVTTDTASQVVSGTAVDVAGNSSGTSSTVKLDKTAPTINGSASPAPNGAGWNKANVTVSYSCNDATSGIATCPTAQTISTEGAGQSTSGTATDAASNSTLRTVSGINIDKTAPTITTSVSGTPNAYGYRPAPVTVTFTCSDALSGIPGGTCPAPIVLNGSGNLPASGTVSDAAGNESVASINVLVTNPPIAGGQGLSASRRVATPITLAASDPNDDPLTYTIVDGPTKGSLSCTGAACTYTSAAGQSGDDSFTFRVSDGTADSNVATVSIALTNDPPSAAAQTLDAVRRIATPITLGATDANFDPVTFEVIAPPTKGNVTCDAAGSCSYTSSPGTSGDDSFTFSAQDDAGGADSAVVTIHLLNSDPIAADQSLDAPRRVATAIVLSATDANSDTLAYAVATGPTKGSVDCTGPACTYTSSAGQSGSDSFTFTVDDGFGGLDTGTVDIALTNTDPTADAQSVSAPVNVATPITVTGSDANQDSLTFSVTTDPTKGAVTCDGDGECSYRSNPGATGADAFTFTVDDGHGGTDAAVVSISLSNDRPLADPQSVTAPRRVATAITLTGSDPNGDALTYAVVDGPTKGSLSCTGAACTYTSAAGQTGSDSFTFTTNDGAMTSLPATVAITLANSNPTAASASYGVTKGIAKAFTLTGSDPNQDNLTFSIVDQPTKGVVSCTGPTAASCTYTATSQVGTDAFTFIATDPFSGSSTQATVTIGITLPRVSVGEAKILEPDAATQGVFVPLTVQAPLDQSVTVTYYAIDGTAVAGSDFTGWGTAAKPRTITLPAGKTWTPISPPIKADALDEADETFQIKVASAVLADNTVLPLGDATATVTIIDSYRASSDPLMIVQDASVYEGDLPTGGKAQFVIQFSKHVAAPFTLSYTTLDGTATGSKTAAGGGDHKGPISGTIKVDPTDALLSVIDVPIWGDTVTEDNETLQIQVLLPDGVAVIQVSSNGWITLLNDD